tara:strand:+ start:143 stop:451 length:309 start_codon:yes stop_codon:yes gene_type:complete
MSMSERPPVGPLTYSEVPNWMIKYCGSYYKPQAESLSTAMIKSGLNVVMDEGETGQFELYVRYYVQHETFVDMWTSFMKEGPGIPKFFTLDDVKLKLSKQEK